jgi:integrase
MKRKSTIRIHASGLASFRDWLSEHGLTKGTVDVYVRDVKKAGAAGGFLERLLDEELAPKTKRHILAASRRWAEFTDDDDLTKSLKKLRLPPARRRAAKVPLTRDELFLLVDEIARADYIDDIMRGVLGMMAFRGLRCGDVLRIRQLELVAAKENGTLSFEGKGRRRLEFKVLKTYRRSLLLLANAEGKWGRVDELVSPDAGEDGRRSAAARAVERALTRCGIKVGIFGLYPHRLRRTYAVEYLRSMRGDPEALIKLTQHMCWASMATAMEYVDHQRGDELDSAAEKIFER